MANLIWPLALPQSPQREPWQKQQPSNVWTFDADEGPAMVRPKGEKGQTMSMEFWMNPQQWAAFEQFWKIGLNRGVLPFDYTDPDTRRVVEVRFDPAASPAYTVKAKGARGRLLSMTWEILP